jgi:predicted nucleic acid-binding protein
MKRTYVDAGVLIAAARGSGSIAQQALEILDDPDREFASSIFVKLEVLPKAVYHKNEAEVAFYRTFFEAVLHWADALDTVSQEAFREACYYGLAAMDALHVAAAASVEASELVTTERPDKPIHRARSVPIRSIWNQLP